jgi:hypothetical protein
MWLFAAAKQKRPAIGPAVQRPDIQSRLLMVECQSTSSGLLSYNSILLSMDRLITCPLYPECYDAKPASIKQGDPGTVRAAFDTHYFLAVSLLPLSDVR